MTDAERRRYFQGRHDWRENSWQDHCGEIDCGAPGNCCQGEIPRNDRVAEQRARFSGSILGAEIERL